MEPALHELIAEGRPDDEVALIVRLAPGAAPPPELRIVTRFRRIATVRCRRSDIRRIRETEGIASLKRPRAYWPDLELVESDEVELLSTDSRRSDTLDVTGRGVVVGVVDWGLDFVHPAFRNPDGSTRLVALWDQRPGSDRSPANPYGYGLIHRTDEIDRALRGQDPYAALGYHPADAGPGPTHGTHTTAIAAGREVEGLPAGLAPDAAIVFVHLGTATGETGENLGDSVALLEALDFIDRAAGNRPWVVNLSMGRHAGPHDGSTLTEQGIDELLSMAAGRACVQSTGNYFSRPVHTSGMLRPGEVRDIHFDAPASMRARHEIDIWYSGRDRLTIELVAPSGASVATVAISDQADVRIDDRSVGRLYNRRRDPNNHDNEAQLFLDADAPTGRWTLRLHASDVLDGRYHCWVERDPVCSSCQPAFEPDDVDARSTTGTICNGWLTIATGAYDGHDPRRPLARFSSAGPTRDGRQKPDLVAPGVRILSARSAPRDRDAATAIAVRMSGTSMAAPHVTGTIALMFEAAGRKLAVRQTRELLLGVAEPLRGYPEARWGSGYLDVERAVGAARRAGASSAAPAAWSDTVEAVSSEAADERNRDVVPLLVGYELGRVASAPVVVPAAVPVAEPVVVVAGSGSGTDPVVVVTPPAPAPPSDEAEALSAEQAAPGTPAPACRVADAIQFDTSRSFVYPRFRPVIERALIAGLARPSSGPVAPRADRFLLVVGHTDTVGTRAVNAPLSRRRARAALAVLTSDVAEWERIAEQEHWAEEDAEIEAMAAEVDAGADRARIRRYRTSRSERRGLIERYLVSLRPAWLPVQSPPLRPNLVTLDGSAEPILGCAEAHLRNPRPGAVRENRRAEFFYFTTARPGISDCADYRTWQTVCDDVITLRVELVDEYGEPYVGPFELTGPTGQTTTERTDATGSFGRPGAPAGRYTVTIHGRSLDLL